MRIDSYFFSIINVKEGEKQMNKKSQLNQDMLDSIAEAVLDTHNHNLPKAATYQELEKILNS